MRSSGMSTGTSFFILMVGPLPSPFLSRSFPSTSLPPHLFVSLCFPPTRDSTVAPLSAIPSSLLSLSSRSSFVSLFLSPLLPFLLAPADSTAFFYLGANVLIACGRSSRPSRVPFPSVSSRGYFAATDHRNGYGRGTRLTHLYLKYNTSKACYLCGKDFNIAL